MQRSEHGVTGYGSHVHIGRASTSNGWQGDHAVIACPGDPKATGAGQLAAQGRPAQFSTAVPSPLARAGPTPAGEQAASNRGCGPSLTPGSRC
eukprot:12205493-Alexandrium_andersonii.AAC.1